MPKNIISKNEVNKELSSLDTQRRLLLDQLNKLQQGIEQKNSDLSRLEYIKSSLSELNENYDDSEILAQFGDGIFIKAKLKDIDRFVVNVGANMFVEKKKDDLINAIDEIIKKNEDEYNLLVNAYNQVLEQYNQVENRIKELLYQLDEK